MSLTFGLCLPHNLGRAGSVETAPTPFLLDGFDEAGATDLDAHTPDIGGAWVRNTDTDYTASGAEQHIVAGSSKVARKTISAKSTYYLPENASADLDITIQYNVGSIAGGNCLFMFRTSLATFEGYGLQMAAGEFKFRRFNADLDLYTGTQWSATDSPIYRLKMVGSAYTLWETDIGDGDTPVDTGTDATHAGPGYCQLYNYGSSLQVQYCEYLKITEL